MQNYDKNNKPLVKVASTKPAFKMKSENLAPVSKPATEKGAFGENVMPRNKVTSGSSSRLQNANRLPGRVNLENGSAPFAK